MEQINSAINSVKVLRSNVGEVFLSLSNGINQDNDETLLKIQELLNLVNQNLRDLEQNVSTLNSPTGPFNLGNYKFHYLWILEKYSSYQLIIPSFQQTQLSCPMKQTWKDNRYIISWSIPTNGTIRFVSLSIFSLFPGN